MKDKIYEIGNSKGINTDIFYKFMTKRFPNEKDIRYITEWAERFSTGAPQMYMDGISRAIYEEVIREYKRSDIHESDEVVDSTEQKEESNG